MITITSSHGMPLDEPIHLPVPDTAAWRAAEAAGVDLVMLFDSIQMTPEQRIQQHASALNQVTELREAFQKQHAGSGKTR